MTAKANGRTRAPISAHPVFPAVVALWFAALLGVGSLVLPVALFETLANATGLAAVLPAAQPPLGATARILIALVAAGFGVAAGLAIARQVAAAQAIAASPRKRSPRDGSGAASHAKRPISAREELGVDKLDDPLEAPFSPPIAGRRRALSVTEEGGRSDFLESAPLPGYASAADPLDLGDFAESAAAPHDAHAPDAAEPLDHAPVSPAFAEAAAIAAPAADAAGRRAVSAGEAGWADSPAPEFEDDAAPIHEEDTVSGQGPYNPFSGRAFGEPVPRAYARPGPQTPLAGEPEPARAPRIFDAAPGPVAAPPPPAMPGEPPLRELGMVALVERFALSLQRRAAQGEAEAPLELPQLKAVRPALADPEAPAQPAKTIAAMPPIEPEAEEAAAPAGPPVPLIPAALRPVALDDDADGAADDGAADSLAGLSLALETPRPFARPEPAPESAHEPAPGHDPGHEAPVAAVRPAALREVALDHEDDDEDECEGYSSLLAMKSPLGGAREFVRIDDDAGEAEADGAEPVVVFPGHLQQRRAAPASDGPSRDPASHPAAAGYRPFDGPAEGQVATHGNFANTAMPTRPAERRADPGETERALRDALEKLQKMSGAA